MRGAGGEGLSKSKHRLDALLVARGHFATLAEARASILAGEVSASGRRIPSAGMTLAADAELIVAPRPRFVGRGGEKLAHALERFALPVNRLVAADIGASTGGFTDCLLQNGAAHVYAVDVAYGVFDQRLRADPRVTLLERTNARHLRTLPEPVDLVVIDVSFISLTTVLEPARWLLRPGGDVIALVKPQFQARREEVGRGGVVRDPLVQARVLGRVAAWCGAHALRVHGLVASPILGSAGNREFLLWLRQDAAAHESHGTGQEASTEYEGQGRRRHGSLPA